MTATEPQRAAGARVGGEPEHHDVFISYTRTDGTFVRELQDALGERGLKTWVDWQDIAPSAEWMQEILGAIEATDTFVFVMSPDSLASAVCARELDHAVASSKRIVPVVHRDAGGSAVPEVLSKLNWLFLREDDDFDAGVDALAETIATDLDRVKLHTRLLVRAREWERAHGDKGKLLRGNDLVEAERFLGSSGGGVHPVESQIRYVTASRKAAGRRQRTLIAGVSLALVISLVLASLALVQRGEALAQRDQARARALAASSVAQLDSDPELSLLLAIEAGGISKTPEVASALRQAINASLDVRVLAIEKIGLDMRDVAVSPDGGLIAAADALGQLHLWDAQSGERIDNIHVPALTSSVARIGFAADGRALVASGSGLATVPIDAARVGRPGSPIASDAISDAAFLPGGRIAVAGRGIRIIDAGTGRVITTLDLSDRWSCIAVSADRSLIVAGSPDGTATVWEVRSGRVVQRLVGHQGPITAVDFASDGRMLATASGDRSARIWDARTGVQLAVLPHTAPVTAVAFGASSEVVGTGDENGVARVWDLATSEIVATLIGHRDRISAMAFRPGSDQVVTSAHDGTVRVWRVGTGVPETEIVQGQPQAAAPMPNGTLAVLSKDGSVGVVDPATGDVTRTFETQGRFTLVDASVATDPGASQIAASGPKGQVDLWDTASGALRVIGPSGFGDPRAEGFALFPSGRRIALLVSPGFQGSGYAGTWDLGTDAPIDAIDLPPLGGSNPAAADVSADGRWIAMSIAAPGGEQDMAVVIDAATGEEVKRFLGHDDFVVDVSFSPDESRLATAAWDGTAAIWDVVTGARILTLAGSRGPVVSADYSPDGQFLVTASDDGTVRVWSADGDQIQVFRTAVHPTDARFAADGRSIIAVGDNRVRVYRCEVCDGLDRLITLAQSRATRALTAEERAKYLSA